MYYEFLKSRSKADSISMALPYMKVELLTLKFSIYTKLFTLLILNIAEVSVIDPVLTLPTT